MIVLVTGGSASGKSEYAEKLILEQGQGRRIYIATMHAWDEESKERIRRHRRMRSQKQFATVECYTGLDTLELADHSKVSLLSDGEEQKFAVLLECMSNLTANELYESGGSPEAVITRIVTGIQHLKKQAQLLVIVTNEVFSDAGDYDPETRNYLSILGQLNQQLAGFSEEVTEVVYGIPVTIKK